MQQINILESTKKPYNIIFFTVLTVVFALLAFLFSQMSLAEGKNFDDDRNAIYRTVHIDITSLPTAFEALSKDGNETFYIAGSSENEYIVKLNKKQYKKIKEEYEKNKTDFKYHIVGRTYYIFENLEKASQSAYNNDKGEKIITSSNYEEYFGQAYIDGTENPGMIVGAVFSIMACVLAVVALISVIEYIHTITKLKRAIKEYGRERLEEQLTDPQMLAYQKAGVYLTRQYLISNAADFKVISYDSIFWVYILDKRLNFISIGKFIMAATKDGKSQPVAYSRNKKMLEEIMAKIYDKNPSVRLGYSKENRDIYKNYLNRNR